MLNANTKKAVKAYTTRVLTELVIKALKTASTPTATTDTIPVTTALYSKADIQAAHIAITEHKGQNRNRKRKEYDRKPLDIFASYDDISTMSKIVAFVTAKNALMREGTKTQQDIYNACCRHEWTHHDVADIIQVAALTLWECVCCDIPKIKREIAVLKQSVDMLKPLNLTADYMTIKRIVNSGKKYTDRMTNDYRKNKSAADMLSYVLTAAEKHDMDNAIHAAFLAVNQYLTSLRAVHASRNNTISIDDLTDIYSVDGENSIIDRIEIDTNKTEKRRLYLSAYTAAKDYLTDSQTKTYKLLIKGYTVNQIAARRKLSHSTINDHKQAIAAAFINGLKTADNAAALAKLQTDNAVILDIESAAAVIRNKKTVAATAAQNAEISAIRNTINDDVKAHFNKYIRDLKDINRQIYNELASGTTVRNAAEKTATSKSKVDRIKSRIQSDIIGIIESKTGLSVDRDKLRKMPLVNLVSIFA